MISGTIRMESHALMRHVSYSFIAPEPTVAGPGPYYVLYQLHGKSDDHYAWVTYSCIIRHLHGKGAPFLVICPDGGISFWLNLGETERYEDFLINDLMEHIKNTFNVHPGKAAIGGLSMGGYGALRLALKYPHLFASVWGHSSALWDSKALVEQFDYLNNGIDRDIYKIAENVNKRDLPVIGFDCGRQDFLIEENRRFHQHLLKLGIPHTYKEHTGKHEWDYWDRYVEDALNQHIKVLCNV